MAQLISIGDYLVKTQCPHCDRHVEVPCTLEQVLKVKGSEGSLTVALAAKPVPHNCDQEQLAFDDDDQGDLLEAAEALGSTLHEGESMTMTTVNRQTGEIREATLHGRGVRL